SSDVFDGFSDLFKKVGHFERCQVQAIKRIDGIKIDRNGNYLTIDTRADTMLVRTPFCEPRKIFEYLARVCMKDMRAILMNQYAGFVVMIISIAADVRALVAQNYFFVGAAGETFSQNAARESCANY